MTRGLDKMRVPRVTPTPSLLAEPSKPIHSGPASVMVAAESTNFFNFAFYVPQYRFGHDNWARQAHDACLSSCVKMSNCETLEGHRVCKSLSAKRTGD